MVPFQLKRDGAGLRSGPEFMKTARSEQKLQSQLNSTVAAGADDRVGGGHIWSGASATEVSGGRIIETETILAAIGIGKVGMVENVEELRPELGPKPFPKLPVLRDREIDIAETRIGKRVSAHVAKLPERRRNHDRVAFGITAKQVEGRGRGPGGIPPVKSQCFRVASGIVGGIRLTVVAREKWNRCRS